VTQLAEKTSVPPKARPIAATGLAVYLVLLLLLTLAVYPSDDPVANFVPFSMVAHDIRVGGEDFVINFLGNLAAFTPFGFLLPAVRRRRTTAWQVAAASLALSASIEALQYLSGRRVADVDDLTLNTLSGLFGYAVFQFMLAQRDRRSRHVAVLAEKRG
jgi:glycopeptide antibiotics resistance protein